MKQHRQSLASNHALARALLLICALFAIPWNGSHAESLNNAWAMALLSDGTLAAVRSDRQAAEADQTAAQRQRWPALDFNGTYTQFEHAPNLDIATPAGQLQAPFWRNNGYALAGGEVSFPLWRRE